MYILISIIYYTWTFQSLGTSRVLDGMIADSPHACLFLPPIRRMLRDVSIIQKMFVIINVYTSHIFIFDFSFINVFVHNVHHLLT